MTFQTAERIVAALPADERDAFHVADAVQRFLFAGDFEYRTDVRGLCGGNQVVDCFLRTRAGPPAPSREWPSRARAPAAVPGDPVDAGLSSRTSRAIARGPARGRGT